MARFALGLVIGALCLGGAELLFLTQGGMPVEARNAKPLPLERFLSSRALHVALVKESSRPSPLPADEANLLAGARVYRENCMVCHGAAGTKERTPIAAGMFPRPPRLVPPGKGVTDDPVGETYWKVKNGIRLTGMPGFEGALTDTDLWQVSLLLLHANELPDAVARQLR
jgi:mono/diheme cytochrome c family protein